MALYIRYLDDLMLFKFLFMYPSATLNCYSKGWYLIRISPLSAGRTNIECEYYKHKATSLVEMEDFLAFGKQVQKEVRFS